MASRYDNIPRLEAFGKSQLGNKYPSKGTQNTLDDLKDQIATILSQDSTDARKTNEILYLVEESLWLAQIVAKAELRARRMSQHQAIIPQMEVRKFKEWLERPNGFFRASDRLKFESGGGPIHVTTDAYSSEERNG